MEVIRKAAVVLIFAALVSFVSNFADAEHSASGNRVEPSKASHWSFSAISALNMSFVVLWDQTISFTTIATTQIVSTTLIQRSPFLTAQWLPIQPPSPIPAARHNPIFQHTLPLNANTISAKIV